MLLLIPGAVDGCKQLLVQLKGLLGVQHTRAHRLPGLRHAVR